MTELLTFLPNSYRSPTMTTILYHPFSKLHNPTYNHPDNPARIDAILEAIKPNRTQRSLRPATFEELAEVHTPDYIRSVLKQQGQKGSAGPGALLTEHSVDAALWSAGAAIEAADVAMSGNTSIAICRPSGHHARPHTGMGFCVFNNVAIAATHCLAKGVERVFIWIGMSTTGTAPRRFSTIATRCFSSRSIRSRLILLQEQARRTGLGRGLASIVTLPWKKNPTITITYYASRKL